MENQVKAFIVKQTFYLNLSIVQQSYWLIVFFRINNIGKSFTIKSSLFNFDKFILIFLS